MKKKEKLNRKKLNPYDVVYTGTMTGEETQIQEFKFNNQTITENKKFQINSFKGYETDEFQYWLNIHGIQDTQKVFQICEKLQIHNLSIQDILDVNQRPKFQEFDNFWFFSIKSILPGSNSGLEEEQLSFVLGKNYLVSFQERKADYFDHIRHRLRNKIGRIREREVDYLLFLLLESILDNYSETVMEIQNETEKLSFLNLDSDPLLETLRKIELYKRQTHHIKNTIIPIKDFVLRVEREHDGFIQKEYLKYYFELRDLCLSLIDSCDHIEVRLDSNSNLFFSIQGHRMNQIMKTLTVVASIFIPLTFIAGIYGMNFSNMPELSWKYGYLAVWIFIIFIFILMMIYFKKKKWF